MIRVTWTIALCLVALAAGGGTASAAAAPELAPLLPAGFAAGDEADEEGDDVDRPEESPEDEAESDPESDETAGGGSPKVVDVRAAYAGSTRLRGLRKLTYLATCPAVDCELSVDVELRFPGGRRVVLASPLVKLNSGELDRISVRATRSARRLMRRAARSDQSVLAVATVFSWDGSEPTLHEEIRTRLR
jgi:hypothetical protein